jgi:alkylated DNA repair dioxygenase AlkB
MQLFLHDPIDILPHDGSAKYHGPIMNDTQAHEYYQHLLANLDWKHDEAKIFGKHFITKRKAAWYGDEEYDYTYSNITKKALIWTAELRELKAMVEEISNCSYNSCLANLYHDGAEGMSWHSDGEKTLEYRAAIASLSFGAERKFSFKHKESKLRVDIELESGSLLVMKGETQEHWLHRLPPTKKIHSPRINLTFRSIKL